MKINKRFVALLMAGLLAFLLFRGKGELEEWMPSQKPKKNAKADYTELRKNAFSSVAPSPLPQIPAIVKDPFKSRRVQSCATGQAKSIKRNYVLKGIMRNPPLLAVIIDETGESFVVKAGETFKGLSVISVTPSNVTLKDAYGTFSLAQK
jgi:hypothetical protein